MDIKSPTFIKIKASDLLENAIKALSSTLVEPVLIEVPKRPILIIISYQEYKCLQDKERKPYYGGWHVAADDYIHYGDD
jgi:hypothetical protein